MASPSPERVWRCRVYYGPVLRKVNSTSSVNDSCTRDVLFPECDIIEESEEFGRCNAISSIHVTLRLMIPFENRRIHSQKTKIAANQSTGPWGLHPHDNICFWSILLELGDTEGSCKGANSSCISQFYFSEVVMVAALGRDSSVFEAAFLQ